MHEQLFSSIIYLVNKKKTTHIVRANYCTRPRAHVNIITIVHPIADTAISNPLLTAFKLLQQPEVPRNYITITNTNKSYDRSVHNNMINVIWTSTIYNIT